MDILLGILTVVEVIVCLLLILIVLMQRPRQEGLGASFGDSTMNQLVGSQTTNVLQRGTVYLAVTLFVITVTLAVLTTRKQNRRSGSEIFAAPPPVPAAPALPGPVTPGPVVPGAPGTPSIQLTPAAPATKPAPATPAPATPATPAPTPAPATPTPAPATPAPATPAPAPTATPAPAPAPASPAPADAPKSNP